MFNLITKAQWLEHIEAASGDPHNLAIDLIETFEIDHNEETVASLENFILALQEV